MLATIVSCLKIANQSQMGQHISSYSSLFEKIRAIQTLNSALYCDCTLSHTITRTPHCCFYPPCHHWCYHWRYHLWYIQSAWSSESHWSHVLYGSSGFLRFVPLYGPYPYTNWSDQVVSVDDRTDCLDFMDSVGLYNHVNSISCVNCMDPVDPIDWVNLGNHINRTTCMHSANPYSYTNRGGKRWCVGATGSVLPATDRLVTTWWVLCLVIQCGK
jgi:hypothetical protein